ncbi:MAG: hypothetical protein M3O26_19760 [Pseudomonadota bacterium]|nr:hypothetical protein [Pseudomonadota bacterium]
MAQIAIASVTAVRVAATFIVSFMAVAAAANPPEASPQKDGIDSTTVAAPRDRAAVERQVRTFVNAIAVKPGEESLARWQSQIPLCPLVAGMPSKDGEYILSRVSKIATAAGAPLASSNCKGNFYIIVTSDPEGVIKAWSKRDVRLFGDEADQGGAKIREFNAARPIRIWYNTEFYRLDGTPLGNAEGRTNDSARATRLETNNYRALSSIIALVDTRHLKNVSYGQVAAYVSMIGLVQLRPQANVTDMPTILNLFSDSAKAPPAMTAWDESFLKAVYQTRSTDKAQLAAIKSAMVEDVAP